ncbi:class I SAM-dependent methyltransferase [Pantanalinema sp. GBBB05]|uniref:class I SAM-dependent methyltransferase n=1 Tax=Pantanalinema sp. GBBB05 TaxID=2604139 RepID=UPI001D9EDD25|nr:class I SAM-dependent methyltransferase [Pantanalinema sp. GBBB05]
MKICYSCSERFNHATWICPACGYQPKKINCHWAFAPEIAQIGNNYEISFFPELFKLEEKNFWFRSRNRLIIWALKKFFPQSRKILEIGCGTGFVLAGLEQALPHVSLAGSELYVEGLNFAARRLSRTELFQMDACKIPFEAEFDVIGAFDVLEHIETDIKVLAEMYRSVSVGGGIVLTVPQHPWLWSYADDYAHHIRRYRANELKIKVERVGFKVVKMTSFVSLLLPLMLASRLQQQQPMTNYDPTSELRINGLLNKVLENLLSVEHWLIRSGISFPAGGSLLLVAIKV